MAEMTCEISFLLLMRTYNRLVITVLLLWYSLFTNYGNACISIIPNVCKGRNEIE
jgi:hypothetical protein